MQTDKMVEVIEAEIHRLRQVRDLLIESGSWVESKAKPKTPAKRFFSPQARARIVAAQKKRWAKQKKSKAD